MAYDQSCLVTYAGDDVALTWYEAVQSCVARGAMGLASVQSLTTSQVSFIDADSVPLGCAWVALVREFFYWTRVERASSVAFYRLTLYIDYISSLYCTLRLKRNRVLRMLGDTSFLAEWLIGGIVWTRKQ